MNDCNDINIVDNYVEPFAGSAAMLLGAPEGNRVETINDFDGFVANFWRAIAHDPDGGTQMALIDLRVVGDEFAGYGKRTKQALGGD